MTPLRSLALAALAAAATLASAACTDGTTPICPQDGAPCGPASSPGDAGGGGNDAAAATDGPGTSD